MPAAEIAHHIFPRVASFLVRDHHTALRAEHGETTRHGFVVGKTAVAVQFNPICKTSFDVIKSKWPLHMSRDLDTLPGGELAINFAAGFTKFCLNCLNSRIKIDIVLIGVILQILQTPFQFKDRLFKIERLEVHSVKMLRKSYNVKTQKCHVSATVSHS